MLSSYLSDDFKKRHSSLLDGAVDPEYQGWHSEYISEYALKPLFNLRQAFCSDLTNCVGRQAIQGLLHAVKHVLFWADHLKTLLLLESVNVGGGSPDTSMTTVGQIFGNIPDDCIDEIEFMTQAMQEGNVSRYCTPVTDVCVELHPKGAAAIFLMAVQIKYGHRYSDNTPTLSAWMQGLNGLRLRDYSFSVLLTPHNAKLFFQKLEHKNLELTTTVEYYNFLPKRGSGSLGFGVKDFWRFVSDLMSIVCSESSSKQ